VTGAEVAFREVTRAAYDAFVSSPPVIAYRIVAHERDRYYDRSVRYAIRYDTRTGMAHRHDITWGDDADERPFLAAPNLDAVGSFTSRLWSDRYGVVFTAYDVVPLDLAQPSAPAAHVDAWTASNGAYVAQFDAKDPSGTTLELTPTDRYRGTHGGWLLTRLTFDPGTKLPKTVVLRAGDDGWFTLEYQTVAGHRVLAKATFDQDANLFLNGEQQHGKEHVHFDAMYEAYAFLQPPPDAAPAASKPAR
jgi:hypothetical protein